jgi:hypothetical protein
MLTVNEKEQIRRAYHIKGLFDAAGVPKRARRAYYEAFKQSVRTGSF